MQSLIQDSGLSCWHTVCRCRILSKFLGEYVELARGLHVETGQYVLWHAVCSSRCCARGAVVAFGMELAWKLQYFTRFP
jgi:hypothetical protein